MIRSIKQPADKRNPFNLYLAIAAGIVYIFRMSALRILITGGAGFIGSHLIRRLLTTTDATILNVDALTYAGNLDSLRDVQDWPRYRFLRQDIRDAAGISAVYTEFEPDQVVNLAAESHVDRSIAFPDVFIQTNIVGTFTMLEAARAYWIVLPSARRERFRFLHISTDEVYGSLGPTDAPFCEETPYMPRNPYSASKAAADHLVRTWHETYGFPTLITNCSNNYGPFQYPEKLIPQTIACALRGKPLAIHGDGRQIRDWLFVEDHVAAIQAVLERGRIGRSYLVGGENQHSVREVVDLICGVLDERRPLPNGSYRERLVSVADRPGNDRRYAVDSSRIRSELGWNRSVNVDEGLRRTVEWYLANESWLSALR